MEATIPTVSENRTRTKAFLALLLLVPAPFIGTWFGLFSAETRGTSSGQTIYLFGKIWILVLPLLWLLLIERGRPSLSPARRGGFKTGVASGLLISAAIFTGWLIIGRHWIAPETIRETATAAGIGRPLPYLLFTIYICTINAILEEYVWRWFVFEKSSELIAKAGAGAILLSAFLFTLHHIIALMAQLNPVPALLCSAGVFTGGCIWSALYMKYRSIWPGFVSHAIVDVAIFTLGAYIIFFKT